MKITYKILLVVAALGFSGCEKLLDRPQLTEENDETAWSSEEKLRLYANKYMASFFAGYSGGAAPLINFTNSDDIVVQGKQPNFTRAVPVNSIWDMENIRSTNIMISRIESKMTGVLTEEAKNHWLGVARFYRAVDYANLVRSYGDVPYYDFELQDIDTDQLYKPRTSRNEVMDHVYEDWQFALNNVRLNDGDQTLNRYIVAAMVSRLALFEGTWQKYYYNNTERARKFLELSRDAAQIVVNSKKFAIELDYKSQFTSKSLAGSKDMILYRVYDGAVGVTHSISSYGNLQESTLNGPTTDLIKAYILNDGSVWETSTMADANDFDITNLIETRDSRFEATFYSKPDALNKGSLFYITKFFPREVEKILKEVPPNDRTPEQATLIEVNKGSKNETDAPVLRYAEVLLNLIEAKAELATVGGDAVTQTDIEATINVIRKRPLAPEAIARGVKQTAAMTLANLPVDPSRDPGVSALIWEIRRERRMEFVFETFRLTDLRRWSKLEYMDNDENEDLLSGGWIDFPAQMASYIAPAQIGKLSVVDLNGNETVYTGSNSALMKGFYKNQESEGRLPFLNISNVNPYLTPIGFNQMDQYRAKGYELKQTQGWPEY